MTSTIAPAASPSGPRKPRRLLCMKEVVWRTNVSRPQVYRLVDETRDTGVPLFPLPVQISKNRIAWHEHEIEEWIASRPRAGGDPSDKAGPKPVRPVR